MSKGPRFSSTPEYSFKSITMDLETRLNVDNIMEPVSRFAALAIVQSLKAYIKHTILQITIFLPI